MKDIRNFGSVDDILDFAIEKEAEAAQFYSEWSAKVKNSSISNVLKDFAEEERKHKASLIEVKEGKKIPPLSKEVTNLRISDYLVEVSPTEEMDYQKTLMVAMQREKSAFRLYTGMADRITDVNVKNLFLQLAQEEAKHKLRLETIYDEEIRAEN